MGPDGALWPIYNEEADRADREMVETYNGGMENLLVFAALFSALVTAFLVLSIPLLQEDSGQATVDGIKALSAQIASQAGGSDSLQPYQEMVFQPSASAIGVNVLWICSLFVSLSTSVLAMLAKQWLRMYITNVPSTPKHKAMERQFRYDGLQTWKVDGIVNALPVCIHFAVALFFAGLVVYLWNMSVWVGVPVVILACLGIIGYLFLAIAPLVWEQCPYKSP
ncbi:hypothetical protein CALVIDRAFT_486474, partial [Calocera viscosa TUFC12733]